MSYDLVVKGGRVVTSRDFFVADVAVSGGRIAAIGKDLSGEREVPAEGLYVLPGAIDGHVHLTDPTFPPYAVPTADSFATASVAAAFGGVTTLIDFAQPAPGESLVEELDRRRSDADGEVAIDYSLHLNLRDPDPSRLHEIPAVFERGVPSFKLYMAYEGYRLPDTAILRAMRAIAAKDGLAIIHAENDDVVGELRALLAAEGKTGPRWLRAACPPSAEGEAVHRATVFAGLTGARLLVFHVSCGDALHELRAAKARGQTVFGEATSHHLVLDEELVSSNNLRAQSLAVRPPIRDDAHRRKLWLGLADGTLDIVSTDHCPRRPNGTSHPAGVSGIEARLALVYSFGVREGRIDLCRWVDVCCTMPADVFGLPGKGQLWPGYDADLVLFDPEREVVLSADALHSPLEFSSYDGVTVRGYPVATISRGEVIVENGSFVGSLGRGRFVERSYE